MEFDYTKADKHAELLRNNHFMEAMSKFKAAVANLVADAPTSKGATFDGYVKAAGIDCSMEAIVDHLTTVDSMAPAQGEDFYARAQLMRLCMKELTLSAAFMSGVVRPEELDDIEVDTTSLSEENRKALEDMGLPTLAGVCTRSSMARNI